MAKIFKLRPEAFEHDVRSRTAQVILVVGAFAAAYLLLMLWGAHIGFSDLLNSRTWTVLLSTAGGTLLILGVVGIFLVFGVRASMKANRRTWDSVEVEIGEDYVARRQSNAPEEIRLQRDEITTLEDAGSVLNIRTANKYRGLNVPKLLDGYDEVKATLLSWSKPLRSTRGRTRIQNWAIGGLSAIGMLAFLFALDPVLQVIATVGMMGWMGFWYWYTGRLEGVAPGVRRNYLLSVVVIAMLGTCKFIALSSIFILGSK